MVDTSMGLTDALTIAAVCLMGAMSPGPSLAMVIRHTVAGGRLPGLTAAWSHAVGVGVYALATVFGVAAVLEVFPAVAQGLTWAGAAYLLWLGVAALRAGGHPPDAASAEIGRRSPGAARDGLAMALLNPKIALFFVALFSQFVAPDATWVHGAILTGIAVAVDGGWYSAVVLALAQPRVLARFRARAHWVNRACGVVFIAIAVRIAFA